MESRDEGSPSGKPAELLSSSSNAAVPPDWSRAAKRISRTCHPDGFLEAHLVEQGKPGEDGPERPPLREHLRDRAIEVLLADEPAADEDVAEVLAGDVAPALDDVPLADRQPAPFPAVGHVEVARPAGHVRHAQQPEQLGRSRRTAGAFDERVANPVFLLIRLNHGGLGGSSGPLRPSTSPTRVRITAPRARPCVM